MIVNNPPLTIKPQRPKPDECCGGGSCCPCVWDEYREKLATWRNIQNTEETNKKETNK